MLMTRPGVTVKEVRDIINEWKIQGKTWTLFIGARAGELFDNNLFYHSNKEFSRTLVRQVSGFSNCTATEKFRHSHEILSKCFSDVKKIHKLLRNIFDSNQHNARPEDDLLVELVKGGLCKVIVTTNIGTYLEKAFIRAGMKEGADYEVFIPQKHSKADLARTPKYCWIIKVFGDFDSAQYKGFSEEFDIEKDLTLKEFLQEELRKNVLVIGYDPTWDKGIEKAFPLSGEQLLYINEQAPARNSHFAAVLEQRKGQCLAGKRGNYGTFLKAMQNSRAVKQANNPSSTRAAPPPARSPASKERRCVVISYSHKDEKYLKHLLTHLKGILHIKHPDNNKEPLLREEDIWWDGRIKSGEKWDDVIRKALESARIAIILISANYFSSDYIRETEKPILLEAVSAGTVTPLCVILGPSVFEHTELSTYQVINKNMKHLMPMRTHEQEIVWNTLVNRICEILKQI